MIKEKKNVIKIHKLFISIFVFVFLMSSMVSTVTATVDTQKDGAPTSSGDFTPKLVQAGEYKEATNSYNEGNVKYYLVTHDKNKQGATEVSYKKSTYQLAGVLYSSDVDINFHTAQASDGNKILAYNGPNNITVFFDDGEFNDTVSTNYTAYSRENNSYVGLNKDSNGEPAAVLSKNARTETTTTPSIAGLQERNIIMHKNVYFENLKFDGKNRDMVPVAYKQNGSTKKYRGEYFFHITGSSSDPNVKSADGFVMRDLIIENIGDGDDANNGSYGWFLDTRRKNVAINAHYAPGQVNIENVIIRNVGTGNSCAVIQPQDNDSTYLKDITINMATADKTATPIKVETTHKFSAISNNNQNCHIEDLTTLNVQNPDYDRIYVQNYQYSHVKLPADYRYAVWNIYNGGYFSSAFDAYKVLPEPKVREQKAIQDLRDNYWVVDTQSSISVEDQLLAIGMVINYTKTGANVEHRAPKANIKFIGSEIPSFTIPNSDSNSLWKNADGSEMDINIVAVSDWDTLASDAEVMIPVVDSFVAKLKNLGKTTLYNFDFKEKAKYTKDEVLNGITEFSPSDAKDGDYPTGMNSSDYKSNKAAAITKQGAVEFNNCRFVGLVSKINATTDTDKFVAGNTCTINVGILKKDTYTADPSPSNTVVQYADDDSVYYMSSDENIATVSENGIVTFKKPGEVTIYIKAKDSFNNGEIEKPFDSIDFLVKEKEDAPIGGNSSESNKSGKVTAIKKLVDTGDNSNIPFVVGLILLSALVLTIVLKLNRRFNK